jgi:hypothetical protein
MTIRRDKKKYFFINYLFDIVAKIYRNDRCRVTLSSTQKEKKQTRVIKKEGRRVKPTKGIEVHTRGKRRTFVL